MKHFIVTIPNPIKGSGSRGLDRTPSTGMPTYSIYLCTAGNERRSREIISEHLGMRNTPDGATFKEVADDRTIRTETLYDMSLDNPRVY